MRTGYKGKEKEFGVKGKRRGEVRNLCSLDTREMSGKHKERRAVLVITVSGRERERTPPVQTH